MKNLDVVFLFFFVALQRYWIRTQYWQIFKIKGLGLDVSWGPPVIRKEHQECQRGFI